MTRALGWSTAGQVVNRLGTFLAGIVLARLLTPSDFGVFAVILVVINVLMTVNDIGVIGAVVRWQGDVRNATGTALGIVVGLSLGFYGLLFLAAPTFAHALGVPQATNMLRGRRRWWSSSTASPASPRPCSSARSAKVTSSSPRVPARWPTSRSPWHWRPAGTDRGASCGPAWWGPWSPAPSSSCSRRSAGRSASTGRSARELIHFGVPQAGAAILTEGMLNVDYLIVGSVLGAAPLGIYLLAFNLSNWPTSIVGLGIGRVAFAGFARLVEDRRRLVDAYPRTIGVAVAAILPVVLLLGVLAPEVIRFVYGEKWLPAVTALRFLLVLGGLRIVLELFGNLISADGRPQVNLAIRFVWLVALVPALLLGAHLEGIRGVGIGHMVGAARPACCRCSCVRWRSRGSGRGRCGTTRGGRWWRRSPPAP